MKISVMNGLRSCMVALEMTCRCGTCMARLVLSIMAWQENRMGDFGCSIPDFPFLNPKQAIFSAAELFHPTSITSFAWRAGKTWHGPCWEFWNWEEFELVVVVVWLRQNLIDFCHPCFGLYKNTMQPVLNCSHTIVLSWKHLHLKGELLGKM